MKTKKNEIKVTFQPSGRAVFVLPGTLLLEAAGLAGAILKTPCGGNGTCGKCRVKIVSGDCLQQGGQGEALSREKIDEGWVLACRTIVNGDAVVDIPAESVFENSSNILVDHAGSEPVSLKSRVLPEGAVGVAFDIGTTTVVGTMFELSKGAELGIASSMNSQIIHGDDVISRIQKVREDPKALNLLQSSIIETVNEIIVGLTEEQGLDLDLVCEISIAGNTTMQQLLCGIDVSPLGEVPFSEAFLEARVLTSSELGIMANAEAQVYVFPQVGSFVGGDTVAGMLASRIDQGEKAVLLVDIGTNGEIVIASKGKMLAASTAAGPAFEGARIRQGMRATDGAIEKVIIDDDVRINVIGNIEPIGICGTALIDAAAELLRKGILDETGRFLTGDELPEGLSDEVKKRISIADGDSCFILAYGEETVSGEPVSLCQKDIRELQLANAALRAGAEILMERAGVQKDDLSAILMAGAFGNFIRRKNARRIGIIPDISDSMVSYIGNAASLGAKLALLSLDEREYAENLRLNTDHVDLSSDQGFQDKFSEAMIFPDH